MEPSGGESQDVRSTTVETAVVFRCITCGEILSDSSEVVAACDSLGVVACAGVCVSACEVVTPESTIC